MFRRFIPHIRHHLNSEDFKTCKLGNNSIVKFFREIISSITDNVMEMKKKKINFWSLLTVIYFLNRKPGLLKSVM